MDISYIKNGNIILTQLLTLFYSSPRFIHTQRIYLLKLEILFNILNL